MNAYEPFQSWDQLLDHISASYALYYHAPMDVNPVCITAILRRDGRLHISPTFAEADPFIADKAHLPRFRRCAGRLA